MLLFTNFGYAVVRVSRTAPHTPTLCGFAPLRAKNWVYIIFFICTFFHMPIFSSQALACFFYLSLLVPSERDGIPLEACVHDVRPFMGIS
jgi:hypothetical protein